MEWFFDKIGDFKSGGTVGFFSFVNAFVNAFVYADIISIIYYEAKMFENIQKISIMKVDQLPLVGEFYIFRLLPLSHKL